MFKFYINSVRGHVSTRYIHKRASPPEKNWSPRENKEICVILIKDRAFTRNWTECI